MTDNIHDDEEYEPINRSINDGTWIDFKEWRKTEQAKFLEECFQEEVEEDPDLG